MVHYVVICAAITLETASQEMHTRQRREVNSLIQECNDAIRRSEAASMQSMKTLEESRLLLHSAQFAVVIREHSKRSRKELDNAPIQQRYAMSLSNRAEGLRLQIEYEESLKQLGDMSRLQLLRQRRGEVLKLLDAENARLKIDRGGN